MDKSRLYLKAILLLMLMGQVWTAVAEERGSTTGRVPHEVPGWFKDSFLEISDDVDEASEQGKHVLLFFQLNNCPYCDRMLEEAFEAEPLASYLQQHFDAIAINVRGDRNIAFNQEISVTEKELSNTLKVRVTPAILFLDENNEPVVRVNGYRAPERFRMVLEYVTTKSYQTTKLADYMQAKLDRSVYQLRPNKLFSDIRDLSSIDGPLLLIFEDGSCYDCVTFHDGVLAHELVKKEIEPFTVVRLDADSDEEITDVMGNITTAAALAREYELIYRPGVLVFDKGALVRRHNNLVYPFYFKEVLRYVAGGFYNQMNFWAYVEQRTEELLAAGVVIDLGRPKP